MTRLSILILASAVVLVEQMYAQPPTKGHDLYGDPLPPATIARLGTLRFRAHDSVIGTAFPPMSTELAILTGRAELIYYEITTGKVIRRSQIVSGTAESVFAATADGRRFACEPMVPIARGV